MNSTIRGAILVTGAYAVTCFLTYELFWAGILAGHLPSGRYPASAGFHVGFDLWLLPAVFIGQQTIVTALAAWRGLLSRRTRLAWSVVVASSLAARCAFAVTTYERSIAWPWLYANAYGQGWLGGYAITYLPINRLIWALLETAVFAALLWAYLSLNAGRLGTSRVGSPQCQLSRR
jgi:hypothetical protein